MAQKIQSDLGVSHTCHEPINFHIVPVTYRRFSASEQNRGFPTLKEESTDKMFLEIYIYVKPNFKLSLADMISPILKKKTFLYSTSILLLKHFGSRRASL